nr:YibE/F family protein [Lentzea tibetensis]
MGHGHGHSAADPASARVRRLLLILLVPVVLATVVGALLLYPFGKEQKTGADVGLTQIPVRAVVTAIVDGGCGENCIAVTVKMTDGDAAGQSVPVAFQKQLAAPTFTVGDEVVLSYSGQQPQLAESYRLVDFQRGWPLALLAVLFALAVLLLGRWHGLAALGALVLSFVVLVLFVLPAIIAGESPLTVAVVGAGLIMFIVLYLTHGISARTSTAVLGTLVSLALIGVLGALFSYFARLTGLDDETTSLIALLGTPIDTRGLLLAGAIIGALGVLDDVTVTQTSAVWELRRANASLSWRELFTAGSRIGRDHMSSVVNTLVMAYAGAALPLLLAFSLSGRSLAEILTAEQVAQEIVRTLVGSIGLVAAVPITTALAAFVASRQDVPDAEPVAVAVAEPVVEPEPAPSASGRIEGHLFDPAKGPWERPKRPAAPAGGRRRRAEPGRTGSSGSR